MWICPKCGRVFARQDQSHYCAQKPESIAAYIALQSEDIRPRLEKLNALLAETLPEATACISWAMPTYKHQRNIIHFAAFKKHIGLYPGPEAIQVFASELAAYQTSKGAIRFPHHQSMPYNLIREIARWCWEHEDVE